MSDYHKHKLNRFDLDVVDMLSSESVKMMDDRQFGQYMFLLLESWNIGKNCTLPDDPAALAKLARVSAIGLPQAEAQVDPIVLKKFSDTGDGRIFNARLLVEWKNAKRRMRVHLEKSVKGGKARATQKLESSHGLATGKPVPEPNASLNQPTTPGSVSDSDSDSDSNSKSKSKPRMDEGVNERMKEGNSVTSESLDQQSCPQSRQEVLEDEVPCRKQESSTPVEPQPPKVTASPEAIALCDYAVTELAATGIPKNSYPDTWLTEADALLSYSGGPESLSELKAIFAFARRDSHFMKFTLGIPDLKRHILSPSDKGLRQKFFNARYAAERKQGKQQESKQKQVEQLKFQGKKL
jgi:uncharacterized protein YdaU (DUF1376 family)